MFKTALLCLLLLVVATEVRYQLNQDQVVQKVLAAETEQSLQDQHLRELQNYWQKVVANNPTYRDGYIQLDLINEYLGNMERHQEFWTKIYSLDPNFQLQPVLQ